MSELLRAGDSVKYIGSIEHFKGKVFEVTHVWPDISSVELCYYGSSHFGGSYLICVLAKDLEKLTTNITAIPEPKTSSWKAKVFDGIKQRCEEVSAEIELLQSRINVLKVKRDTWEQAAKMIQELVE